MSRSVSAKLPKALINETTGERFFKCVRSQLFMRDAYVVDGLTYRTVIDAIVDTASKSVSNTKYKQIFQKIQADFPVLSDKKLEALMKELSAALGVNGFDSKVIPDAAYALLKKYGIENGPRVSAEHAAQAEKENPESVAEKKKQKSDIKGYLYVVEQDAVEAGNGVSYDTVSKNGESSELPNKAKKYCEPFLVQLEGPKLKNKIVCYVSHELSSKRNAIASSLFGSEVFGKCVFLASAHIPQLKAIQDTLAEEETEDASSEKPKDPKTKKDEQKKSKRAYNEAFLSTLSAFRTKPPKIAKKA